MKLHIDLLTLLDVHKVQWCSAGPDQLKVELVTRVVETVKFAVVDTEAVLPQVKDALLRFRVSRPDGTVRIGDAAALSSFAAEGHARATEA